VVEPLKVYTPVPPTGENAEILAHVLRVHEATGKKGTWVLDRGFDRRELFGPPVKNAVAFVVRQRGDRTVRTADGRAVSVGAVVAEQACPRPRRWPTGGVSATVPVWLPEVGPDPFLLVVRWRVPGSERPGEVPQVWWTRSDRCRLRRRSPPTPRARTTYTAEYKLLAVKMITDQKLSVAEVGRRLDVGESLLRAWRKAVLAGGDAAFPGGGTFHRPRTSCDGSGPRTRDSGPSGIR